ncbi:VOC family protein [Actinopolyspora mortivallis]|uniref:Glyoxalase-like domain-containing protein n=1 Tax=Actinopolyspora mortivallis TaxID=33906 RepID=A0A2T0GXK2_ACTMO|nr:VOC family protein [Actinopolyspora mortivallis]PRW63849.1 hypothetical protein CEP50_08565 [Actinopolyspora mortivallis]
MAAKFKAIALDAVDHQGLADWWCTVLGYRRKDDLHGVTDRPEHWPVPIVDPEGSGPAIWVNPVPDRAGGTTSGMHLDVIGDRAELLDLGATLVRAADSEIEWDVLADPEGNRFCVFAP